MIEKQSGVLVIHCDSCSEEEEADVDDWTDAWSEWKRNGWRSYKMGDEWRHSCPACVADWKSKQS